MPLSCPADIAQTTPTGGSVAIAISEGYAFGEVLDCVLMRRGSNHVYGLRFADGRRAVARLCARRPRGAPNTEYEAALLNHLKAAGAAVADSLLTRDGAASISMALPEGARPMMLFEHLDGNPPGENVVDIESTGRGLPYCTTLVRNTTARSAATSWNCRYCSTSRSIDCVLHRR